MRQKLLVLQFAVLVVTAVCAVYFGIDRSFSFTVWWWDILLHVLGGAWVALCAGWLASIVGVRLGLVPCIVLALIVGAAWELFEYVFHFPVSPFMSYPLDTIKDLADDMAGGALASAVISRMRS